MQARINYSPGWGNHIRPLLPVPDGEEIVLEHASLRGRRGEGGRKVGLGSESGATEGGGWETPCLRQTNTNESLKKKKGNWFA